MTDRIAAPPDGLLLELAETTERFATASAREIVEWALGRFDRDLVVAASFQDVVLIDLVVGIDPSIEVVFCDTGAHFEETLGFVDDMRARFGLHLTITTPVAEASAWPCGSERCCELRKVAPLREVLRGRSAWLTALKRSDAPTRARVPIVSWDGVFSLVKVNPLATWTEGEIARYLQDHDLPVHPLVPRGYLSIGCAPTTRPVGPDEDARAGRWSGSDKTECGLHPA